ncbi:hypothetical protein K5D65_02770 [Pseudomonas cichorii]|nr:hypothetical protein [Pseudomonas cichorii]
MTTKITGASLGLQFAFEAISRGATVSEPIGDNAAYDFIVEIDGRMSRIQVKSCVLHSSGSGYLVPTSRRVPVATKDGKLSSKCVPYKTSDFEALVTKANETWYVFDTSVLGKNSMYLNPSSSRESSATKFKENWTLLGFKPQLQ